METPMNCSLHSSAYHNTRLLQNFPSASLSSLLIRVWSVGSVAPTSRALAYACRGSPDPHGWEQACTHSLCFSSVILREQHALSWGYETLAESCTGWQSEKMDILPAVDEMGGFYDTLFLLITGKMCGVLVWPWSRLLGSLNLVLLTLLKLLFGSCCLPPTPCNFYTRFHPSYPEWWIIAWWFCRSNSPGHILPPLCAQSFLSRTGKRDWLEW